MRDFTYQEMFASEANHFWFVGKRLFIAKILRNFQGHTKSILDVGCGTGGTSVFLKRWGQVTGVEKSRTAYQLARKRGLTVKLGSANRLPLAADTFDLVTIFDVLYHEGVREVDALKEAYRVLKPGGLLLVTDSAVPWVFGPHDISMDAKCRYTKTQLASYIRNAGFDIRCARYIFAGIFPFFLISRLLAQIRGAPAHLPTPHPIIHAFFIKILTIESWVFPLVPLPIGSSLIILARKP